MSDESERSETPPDKFIEAIRSWAYRGYGFVPLIGSGVSSDSGILTGEQFTNCLACTIHKCVTTQYWNLRENGWPQDYQNLEVAKIWIGEEFLRIARNAGFINAHALIKAEVLDKLETQIVASPLRTDLYFKESLNIVSRLHGLLEPLQWPLVPEILANEDGFRHNHQILAIARKLDQLDQLRDYQAPPEVSNTSDAFIIEKAIRSLYDWRATLIFLSSLNVAGSRLVLESTDHHVMDEFNTHVTDGRKPNPAHNMLAHLARPLRFRTILSTNFDNLIEVAFAEIHHKLYKFRVSISGALPDARAVRSLDSIVKLHGEMSETRADFSLDEVPSAADLATFQAYIQMPNKSKRASIANHVLVAGLSGRDLRIVQFLKHCLDNNGSLKLFWICHNDNDVSRVASIFAEYGLQNKVFITKTPRLDLLLYELYQKCTLSLPPGGFSFTLSHHVAPARPAARRVMGRLSVEERAKLDVLYTKLASAIKMGRNTNSIDQNVIYDETRLKIQLHLFEGYYSLHGNEIVDHAHGLSKSLEKQGLKCIWLELADFLSPQAMLHEILTTISLRRGYLQLQHAELLPRNFSNQTDLEQLKTRLRGFMATLATTPSEWVILLYGRTVPGSSVGWCPNYWEEADYDFLHKLFQELGIGVNDGGVVTGLEFRIIYMPLTFGRGQEHRNLDKSIREFMKSNPAYAPAAPKTADAPQLSYTQCCEVQGQSLTGAARDDYFSYHKSANLAVPTGFTYDSNLDPNSEETNEYETTQLFEYIFNFWVPSNKSSRIPEESDWQKFHFLYSLLLFRQSRHPNAILTDAVFRCPRRFNSDQVDNDWVRGERTNEWMELLTNNEDRYKNIFLKKPGGYAWIYREDRISLLALIEARTVWRVRKDQEFDFIGQIRGRMHNWIAEWYFKAFYATGHVAPLFESFYHRFQALRVMQFDKRGSPRLLEDSKELVTCNRILCYHEALNGFLKSLRVAKPWLIFWLSEGATVDKLRLSNDELSRLNTNILRGYKGGRGIGKRLGSIASAVHLEISEVIERTESPKAHISILPMVNSVGANTTTARFLGSFSFDAIDVQKRNFRRQILRLLYDQGYRGFNNVFSPSEETAKNIAKMRRPWLLDCICDQQRLFAVTQLLGEFAHLHVKRAKLEQLAKLDPNSTLSANPGRRWIEVSMICYEALKLCPHLDASFIRAETLIRTKLLTLYGIALGYLGRFFEAHRRLDEAEALLSKNSVAVDPLELAKVRIRRAEVSVLEADAALLVSKSAFDLPSESDSLTKKLLHFGDACLSEKCQRDDAERLRAARIDDAWTLLEMSRQLLSGVSHSSFWWGQWYTLVFQVYGAVEGCHYEVLPFRRIIDQRAKVLRLFKESAHIAASDRYRQLSFISHCHKALIAIVRRSKPDGAISKEERTLMMQRLKLINRKRLTAADGKITYLACYWDYVNSALGPCI